MNTLGSYHCQNIDYCSKGLHNCDVNISACTNLDKFYGCNCFTGYKLKENNFTCYDIDECHDELHDCTKNETCQNLSKFQRDQTQRLG